MTQGIFDRSQHHTSEGMSVMKILEGILHEYAPGRDKVATSQPFPNGLLSHADFPHHKLLQESPLPLGIQAAKRLLERGRASKEDRNLHALYIHGILKRPESDLFNNNALYIFFYLTYRFGDSR